MNSKPRSSIVRRVTYLVAILLTANAVWLTTLCLALNNAANLAKLERKQSQRTQKSAEVLNDFYNVLDQVWLFFRKPTKAKKLEAQEAAAHFEAHLNESIREAHLSKTQEKTLQALDSLISEQVHEMENINQASDSLATDDEVDLFKRLLGTNLRFFKVWRNTILFDRSALMNFYAPQKKALEKARARHIESEKLLFNIVLIGTLANILFAIVYVQWFRRDFLSRMFILVTNGMRLSSRTPLEKPIQGDDELSYLDKVLHEASDSLRQAFEHRQAVMQMVAHDLRSPLASSKLAMEMLLETEKLSPSGQKRIGQLVGSTNRLIVLLNDLLTIDSLELNQLELKKRDLNIAEAIRDSIDMVASLAESKKISIRYDDTEQDVFADKARIIQVLMNYLTNAIKFSKKDSAVRIACHTDKNMAVISVIDSGIGMNREDGLKVFNKFYRSKEGLEAGGFGLGLAICKLIIESHGGKVGVESEAGKGARFWFSIPLAEDGAAQVEAPSDGVQAHNEFTNNRIALLQDSAALVQDSAALVQDSAVQDRAALVQDEIAH